MVELKTNPEVVVEYRNKKNSSGKIINGIIYLSISSHLSPAERKKHIENLTARLAKKIKEAGTYDLDKNTGPVWTDSELTKLAETINRSYYNLPLAGISFHQQNTTWGTCSLKTRQIYISHRLRGAPLELLWYVVTHEICHLAVPAHNKAFWFHVSKACPDFSSIRKKLKAYGCLI